MKITVGKWYGSGLSHEQLRMAEKIIQTPVGGRSKAYYYEKILDWKNRANEMNSEEDKEMLLSLAEKLSSEEEVTERDIIEFDALTERYE